MTKIIFSIISLLFATIILALCKASGRADRSLEYSERMDLKED